MGKRDIKIKRWEKRSFRKQYGLSWRFWYYAVQALNGKDVPLRVLRRIEARKIFVCGRRPGLAAQTQREINRRAVMALNAITGDAGDAGDAGDGAGANGNMREVETLPAPERSTSKPYSGTNYTENIE